MKHSGRKILLVLLLFFCTTTLAHPEAAAAVIENTCEDDAAQEITKVVDGDTVEFSCGGELYRVRLIGIDAPETIYSSDSGQCFNEEATERMTELVLDKDVILERGEGSDDKDKYDRLLRYISVAGEDVGVKMIRDGYAEAYKVYSHEKWDAYDRLEQEAREGQRGLWAADACGGEPPDQESTRVEAISEEGGVISIFKFLWLLLGF